MSADLIITPFSQVQENPKISAKFELSEMPRLAKVVEPTQGLIEAKFLLRHNDEGLLLEVTTSCDLPLICQRCMGVVEHKLEVNHVVLLVGLGFDGNDTEEDYVVLEDKKLSLKDFLEDEIMLALPLIAKHNNDECQPLSVGEEETNEKAEKTYKPFANLDKLRGKIRH